MHGLKCMCLEGNLKGSRCRPKRWEPSSTDCRTCIGADQLVLHQNLQALFYNNADNNQHRDVRNHINIPQNSPFSPTRKPLTASEGVLR